MLKDHQDAYGHAIYDYFRGRPATEIIERDDGWIGTSGGPPFYLSPHREWPEFERRALRFARGRVLDVGCGGGRVALHLEEKGHEVVGIDISPLAIKTCRARGMKRPRIMSVTQINSKLGRFDTVVMFGNNFGLMGRPRRARWLLGRLAGLTSPSARILAGSFDPYQTTDRSHRDYHRRNRDRQRWGGQVRIRVRYLQYRTPWFDWFLVSQREMKKLLQETPWQIEQLIDSDGPAYVAVLEKREA